MTKHTRRFLTVTTMLALGTIMGCKSTPKKVSPGQERIAAYEVALTTATDKNAEAIAELALIVEHKGPSQTSRQTYPFGRKHFDSGKRTVIKVKTARTTPWIDRDAITFSLATESSDGYLPSHVWIAAISDTGARFTMCDVTWKNKMFSVEKDDPEAISPVESAREWAIPMHD